MASCTGQRNFIPRWAWNHKVDDDHSLPGVLFDMDGVLVDSTQAVARVWSKWAIARGFDPEEVVRAAHGRPSLDTSGIFCPMQMAMPKIWKWSGKRWKIWKAWSPCPEPRHW